MTPHPYNQQFLHLIHMVSESGVTHQVMKLVAMSLTHLLPLRMTMRMTTKRLSLTLVIMRMKRRPTDSLTSVADHLVSSRPVGDDRLLARVLVEDLSLLHHPAHGEDIVVDR